MLKELLTTNIFFALYIEIYNLSKI